MRRGSDVQKLGRWGEELAASYLRQHGYTLLDQNARTPYGEIDLVAGQDLPGGPLTVFVEVKTRRSGGFGLPEESVTARKRAHLLAAAQAYIQTHPECEGTWRIDVIAIRQLPGNTAPEIVHFENAISSE